jgi:hypothetical protein
MRTIVVILSVVVLVPVARAEDPERKLLVLPIFGVVPPEMEIPRARHIAESLLLELPETITVLAEEPAGRLVPEDIEGLVRSRALELKAVAVVWGELKVPKTCRAPRLVRIRILDLGSNLILDRDLCPEEADAGALSRAIAVATMNALRSGLVQSLSLIDDHAAKVAKNIPKAAMCPKCPKQKPCPEPEPCPECLEYPVCPDCPGPPPPRFFLAAGPLFTSHPQWSSYGLGVAAEFSYSPLDWLEVGAGIQAVRGRHVKVTDVNALYTSWPAMVFCRARIGFSSLELTADLGFMLTWSRLEALMEAQATRSVAEVERVNPGILGRAGLRWWLSKNAALHLLAGSTIYLRRQRYTYGYYGFGTAVLSMHLASFEGQLMLVLAF